MRYVTLVLHISVSCGYDIEIPLPYLDQ